MVEIENIFLGSIIKEPENLNILRNVKRDWFSGNNKHVFDAIMFLYNNGKGIDQFTVTDKLKGLLGDKYKDNIIPDLLSVNLNPKHFDTYQDRLEEEHLRKSMVSELYESIKGIESASAGEIKQFVDAAEGRIFQVSQDIAHISTLEKMGDVGIRVMKDIKSYREEGVEPYMSNTGFIDIDKMIGGFKAGDYTLLAATPSQGKTALSLQILMNNIKSGRPVGMISLEMTKEAIFLRLISSVSKIDSLRIANGEIKSDEYDNCVAAWRKINEMPFYIDDNSALNEVTIRGVVRRMVSLYGIKLLVIDHIQEMECSQRKESRQQEIAKISRSLKNLGKELRIPLLVLSQLSREAVRRNPPIPRLSDLRESGALEQDADNVFFIYRPEGYNLPTLMDGTTPSTNAADIIIGKARNGQTGHISVAFKRHLGQFCNLQKVDKSEEGKEIWQDNRYGD